MYQNSTFKANWKVRAWNDVPVMVPKAVLVGAGIRVVQIRVIQRIETLRAELGAEALRDRKILERRDIPAVLGITPLCR